MKVKFMKKIIAVLCVASMSMSCVAGSVGAIEFVRGFEGVDVEGTQKYAEKLNKSIQNLKKKLYDCKDLIELKLGEKQLNEEQRDQLKQWLKLRDEQIKNQQLEKQRLKEKEDAFRSKESLLNNRLCELQQEQNQIYEEKFHLEEMRSKQDITKEKTELEKRQSDLDLKLRKFKNELQKYGYRVGETLGFCEEKGNDVTYEIVRLEKPHIQPVKIKDIALEGYDVVEQNPQQIELLRSLKPQIDKWIDLIERLDKVQFVKAIQLNDDLHLQLDMKADVTISGVINMIKESRLYEGVNKIFEDNYNDLFNTINIYLDEYVILSGNSDTNFNLIERENKEKEKQQKSAEQLIEKLGPTPKETTPKKKVVKKKVKISNESPAPSIEKTKETQQKSAEQPIEKLGPTPKETTPKKKVVKKKIVKKVVKKKSLNEHNKNLDNILNQIEALSKEIHQAENFKLEYLSDCNKEINKLNQKIQDLRQSRESAKSVEGNKGIRLRNGILKDIKATKAEKSKLKTEMEENIVNLEKQIQDKKSKQADLEKQLQRKIK